MDISDLSPQDKEAILRILRYWVQHWDWECPTLFGMELAGLKSVVERWPHTVVENEESSALAIVGAMREFLYGASAVRKEQVLKECGVSYEAACALLHRLMPRIDRALGKHA